MHLRIAIILISFSCLSCQSFRSVSNNQTITADLLKSKLVPGKMYQLTLKSGKQMKVKVSSSDSLNVHGQVYAKEPKEKKLEIYPFLDSFKNLETNVTKVSVLKVNPYITALVIGGPIWFMFGMLHNWDL